MWYLIDDDGCVYMRYSMFGRVLMCGVGVCTSVVQFVYCVNSVLVL